MSHGILLGLLQAYVAGDRLARLALLDWLEEEGDSRLAAVRKEAINWDQVACSLHQRGAWEPRTRWYVDCARVGAETMPNVQEAVREARRRWLGQLFPEAGL